MSMIFISHRSTDKIFADLFADFLLRCGIKSEYIFCSSLPGNDIRADIPAEIKENLRKSVLNIVLLSCDYYKSPYCVNEEGIIWYLDTPKIIISMPEISDKLMEGFLDGDNKIRRLDNKNDLLAIADILHSLFSDFIDSAAKLNANIDKLMTDYKAALETRKVPMPEASPPKLNSSDDSYLAGNYLDQLIANGFTDQEMLFIRYALDSGRLKFKCGFQSDHELEKIRAWEDLNTLDYILSSKFQSATERLLLRKIIQVSQAADGGNPEECEFTENSLKWIGDLTQASKNKLAAVVEKYKASEFDPGFDLPF